MSNEFPLIFGAEREVYQNFNYYDYEQSQINIVDLMNHLAFGGNPHEKMFFQMQNHIAEIYQANATPYRRQRTKEKEARKQQYAISEPSPNSEDESATQNSQPPKSLRDHRQIFKDLIQQKYDAQARILDANFISVYDEKDQKYIYYVERLLGRQVEFQKQDSLEFKDQIIDRQQNTGTFYKLPNREEPQNMINLSKGIQDYTNQWIIDGKQTAMRPIGRQWILFINNQEQDWQQICEQGKQINHQDELVWKFQLSSVNLKKQTMMVQQQAIKNLTKRSSSGSRLLKKITIKKRPIDLQLVSSRQESFSVRDEQQPQDEGGGPESSSQASLNKAKMFEIEMKQINTQRQICKKNFTDLEKIQDFDKPLPSDRGLLATHREQRTEIDKNLSFSQIQNNDVMNTNLKTTEQIITTTNSKPTLVSRSSDQMGTGAVLLSTTNSPNKLDHPKLRDRNIQAITQFDKESLQLKIKQKENNKF